jgi:N-methylhydantoinase A/oxoprolinase/acetone carboxylase beta subunit
MLFAGRWREGLVIDRERLQPGERIQGPAIVVEASATTVVPPDFGARVDGQGNLLLSLAPSSKARRERARGKR